MTTTMKGDKEWGAGAMPSPKGVPGRPEGDTEERPKDGEEIKHWLLEEGNSRQREQQTLKPCNKSMPAVFKDIKESIRQEESK